MSWWRRLLGLGPPPPPPPKRELVALGKTEFSYSHLGKEKEERGHILWYFYRTGDKRSYEAAVINKARTTEPDREYTVLWEDDIRLWIECNRVPKWADPVAARIIQ